MISSPAITCVRLTRTCQKEEDAYQHDDDTNDNSTVDDDRSVDKTVGMMIQQQIDQLGEIMQLFNSEC